MTGPEHYAAAEVLLEEVTAWAEHRAAMTREQADLRLARAQVHATLAVSSPESMVCAVCLYTAEGAADPAETIIGGVAVCQDHAGSFSDPVLSAVIHRHEMRDRSAER